jgi:phage repressor protein C with HTH and peptisase S24 domain
VDKETADYFRARIAEQPVVLPANVEVLKQSNVVPFPIIARRELRPFVNAVPLVELKFAAGMFGDVQAFEVDAIQWVELPAIYRPQPGMFVAQVVGESMNRRIPNGSWCLFRANPQGTRSGKVVVAQHRLISDPESGGSFTVKVYSSKKEQTMDGEWRHSRLELSPDSTDSSFKPLVFGPELAGSVSIVAELIGVLDS